MNEQVVEILAQEVRDDLGAGEVGLYELYWTLNGPPPLVPRSDYVAHARAALDRVLSTEDVVLVWHRWADPYYEVQADVGALNDPHVWDDPTDDPYLAVLPRGDVGWSAEWAARQAAKAARRDLLKRMLGGSSGS